ncbi:hypothetical protein Pyn_17129 [Prunus yedoensis var. nudiflora]|uniref:Uncharacterized protein n=1 Tax=Prunus yedoensis var. nudiflora TaxID=2094558 RepID=A0A314UZU2_PRUYE|nr:hypothetical protein Pyn_17129 [Prunus yedoensis var. nudiflora]
MKYQSVRKRPVAQNRATDRRSPVNLKIAIWTAMKVLKNCRSYLVTIPEETIQMFAVINYKIQSLLLNHWTNHLVRMKHSR